MKICDADKGSLWYALLACAIRDVCSGGRGGQRAVAACGTMGNFQPGRHGDVVSFSRFLECENRVLACDGDRDTERCDIVEPYWRHLQRGSETRYCNRAMRHDRAECDRAGSVIDLMA